MSQLDSNSKAILQSLGLSGDEIYETGIELVRKLDLSGSILDFGCGQGRFLSMLSTLKFSELAGADLMNKPSELPKTFQWLQTDLNKELAFEPESFDVIIAIEVIEHLENPRAVVRELRRILRPGGYLIMSTPNNESIRSLLSLILKGHFVSFLEKDYPAHITALNSLDIKRICAESHFDDISFHYIKKGLIPGLKGITWQQLSFGLLQGKRFSDNVFAVIRK